LAFSPDEKVLTAEDTTGVVYLRSLVTNRIFATLTNPGDSPILSVTFSPDGKIIAISGQNGKTSLWDIATRKRLTTTFTDPDSSGVTTATFSPYGAMLATGDYNGKTYLWNLRTRTLITALANLGGTLAPAFGGKARNAVVSIAFSPDGETLATSGTNGSAYLWRIR
jgi:WD40 repeat protein